MRSAEIRRRFIEFFEARGHRAVPSSALVPDNDPTLFFTNAGMVQFKNVFTGEEPTDFRRATSTQKCLRVSGKHNDLENVGHTPRHHTFFEMLGNFSFGDYFKADAISWAWEFLTVELKIDAERLWVTVHESDDEAYAIWRDEVGIPEARLQRLGDKENFWTMGDTGPCGPCSEIHYDHGPTVSDNTEGPAGEDDRYVEIWNLVFMQFERDADGIQTPLPKPSIDTGAGLERLAAVLQGVNSNYETDCFQPIMASAAEVAGVEVGADAGVDVALQVIADHARATAFLIADGVMPSNEERGYVLRRIMRRAIRYGVKIGLEEPFLWRAVDAVIEHLGEAFTELEDRRAFINEVVHAEEERFAQTLHKGLGLLQGEITALTGETRVIDGGVVFRLHDTFGFPPDLTALIAAEEGVEIDEVGYHRAMEHQRALGRAAWKGSGEQSVEDVYRQLGASHPTSFTGYELGQEESEIIALVQEGRLVQALGEGETGVVITRSTPFYGESGGQIGDRGSLTTDNGRASVVDATKPMGDLIAHHVHVNAGNLRLAEGATLEVDDDRRQLTRLNHTATHLLHSALKQVLGYHVVQKGSLVGPDRLRFDFSHHRGVSRDDIADVEELVNRQVLENIPLQIQEMPIDEARALGAEALFGEKYGEVVRVITVPDFSIELCGGTHVRSTGDIGLFKVVSETGIAAGVRRIEARTGINALHWVRDQEALVHDAAQALRASPAQMLEQIERLQADRKRLEKALEEARRDAARAAGTALIDNVRDVGGVQVLAAEIEGDAGTLREEAERLRDQLGEAAVVVLGARGEGGVTLVATASRDIAGSRVHAGNLIRDVAGRVGGGGGGRPDMAQAGGKRAEALPEALEAVYALVEAQISLESDSLPYFFEDSIMKLQDVNALVTGGASGMGRAFVLNLARDGANVAFCDLNEEGIASVEAEGAALPGSVKGFVANVGDEDSVVGLVQQVVEHLGTLNVLVNNAGIFRDGLLVRKDKKTGELKKMSLKNWNAVINVDLTGPFLCTREFAGQCLENEHGGVIVNISSIARHGNQGQSNYSAAKAGLVADTKLWAGELARYGIRTGAVAPGFVNTPILQGMRPEVLEHMLKGVPLRRVGETEEIYLGVKFIIECDYFTGRCIDVDGGMVV